MLVRPSAMANRPNSTWTKTLITQPSTISHNSQKPASAPVLVVAMSSPEPTIDAAIINPGPNRLRIPPSVRGGS